MFFIFLKIFHKIQNDFNSNSDFRTRNLNRGNQNPAKLIDKYNNLAREALSGGDKILSENYFQHADHFTRILKEQDSQKKNNLINNETHSNEENVINVNNQKISFQEKK